MREVDEGASLEHALVENLQRSDLNPMEEAAAYQQLIEEFGLTHEQVAVRVGQESAAITNTVRLFQLPPAIQRMVGEGRLSAGHARALLGTPDRAYQESLASRAANEGMSVREVEDAVRDRAELEGAEPEGVRAGRGPGPPATGSSPDCSISKSCSPSISRPGSRSRCGARGARCSIDFADLADLERIYGLVVTTRLTRRSHDHERRPGPTRWSRLEPTP